MTPLRYAKDRVASLLKEIRDLKDLDFPYPPARKALDHLEQVFQQRASLLDQLDLKSNPTVVQAACSESLVQAFKHLPLLGFILRSTDTRNAFEVIGPLLRLARKMLGKETDLIVSSEWNFSPHVYSGIEELPNHVLIGLPASESGNPLLIPLAGHELGHAVWKKKRLADDFKQRIQETITEEGRRLSKQYADAFGGLPDDLLFKTNVAPALTWALKQTEETFCDCFGVRLFSEAYLHAFAYLLTPGTRTQRSPNYPNIKRRIQNLKQTATNFHVVVPNDYESWFVDDQAPVEPKASFLLTIADNAAIRLFDELVKRANDLAEAVQIPIRNESEIETVRTAFGLLTPAASVGNLTSLLNAGWQAYHDDNFWQTPQFLDRGETLVELLLKSIEILEIEQRIAEVKS